MGYAIGIDLGTTFTAAGISSGDRLEPIPLGALAISVPSVAFVDTRMSFGEEALARAAARPSRLVREFKRDLGQDQPIVVDGYALTAEQLTGSFAEWVIARCTQLQGAPPTDVVVTHPASWRSFRRERLAAALTGVSHAVERLTLATEPEAAAVYYATRDRIPDGAIIAVYDLGGGTFDAAVLRKTSGSFELIGKPAGDASVGGSDLDQELLTYVLEQAGHPLRTLDRSDPAIAIELGRLRSTVTESKELLSLELDVAIGVRLGQPTEVRVNRRDLERLAEPLLDNTLDTFNEALRNANVTPTDLHSIVLVGGGSRMPLVGQLIATTYNAPIAVDTHPKFAICLGAAILAADRAGTASSLPSAEPVGNPVMATLPPPAVAHTAVAAPTQLPPPTVIPMRPPTPEPAPTVPSTPAVPTKDLNPAPVEVPLPPRPDHVPVAAVPAGAERTASRPSRTRIVLVAAAAVVVVLLGLAFVASRSSEDESAASTTASSVADPTTTAATITSGTAAATTPPTVSRPTVSTPSAAKDGTLAASLALATADAPGLTFRLADAGDRIEGQTSLDVCAATFPSEALRTARHQQLASRGGIDIASDEIVVYRSAADATQAMAEIRAAAANCPAEFVSTPLSGGVPARFTIKVLPNSAVPAVADAVALDITLLDRQDRQTTFVSVYQRRGRVLVGAYARDLDTARVLVAAAAKKLGALDRSDAGD